MAPPAARYRPVIGLAALTGVITGLGVAVFDLVTSKGLVRLVGDSPAPPAPPAAAIAASPFWKPS